MTVTDCRASRTSTSEPQNLLRLPRRDTPAGARFAPFACQGAGWQTECMGMWDPVGREHVLAAVREYDQLGQSRFLGKYKFRPARAYQLIIDGRSYDSKATLGAAYGYATGSALPSRDFSGGASHNGAAWALRRLGFEVAKTADTGTIEGQPLAVVGGSTQRIAAASAPDQAADTVLVAASRRSCRLRHQPKSCTPHRCSGSAVGTPKRPVGHGSS